jgi:DNA-binding NarL/FixJ family response regulator
LDSIPVLRVLCVGRHTYLSEHIARFLTDIGLSSSPAVGLEEAVMLARAYKPHVVVCDYDLLATLSLESWETDELLSRTPVIAVSLTRRPEEVHLLDVNGIGGFLYLPTLKPEAAHKILKAAAARNAIRLASPSLSVSSRQDAPSEQTVSQA